LGPWRAGWLWACGPGGNLFLDLEGDPYVGDTGLEYLSALTDLDDRSLLARLLTFDAQRLAGGVRLQGRDAPPLAWRLPALH